MSRSKKCFHIFSGEESIKNGLTVILKSSVNIRPPKAKICGVGIVILKELHRIRVVAGGTISPIDLGQMSEIELLKDEVSPTVGGRYEYVLLSMSGNF